MAERIKLRMAAAGLSQRALSREVGISHQAISKIISGNTNQTPHILRIAKALQTTPEYLVGETDDPSLPEGASNFRRDHSALPSETGSDSDPNSLVKVHEIDLTMGMGATYLEVPVTKKVRQFDKEWLRTYTHASPDKLFFCEGIGNSMEPYIHSHDLLLIDTSQDSVRLSDQIWAVAYGQCGSIKRLRPMPDGAIKMMSDNPSVSDEIAYDGELQVIGRVVAIVRRI